jgi:hypothetical protein
MDADCGICCDVLFDHDPPDARTGIRRPRELGMMVCGHVYHLTCIARWYNTVDEHASEKDADKKKPCPACRGGVKRPPAGTVIRLQWPGLGSPWPNPLDPVSSIKGKARAVGERAADMGIETREADLTQVLGDKRGLGGVLLEINKLDADHWHKACDDEELKVSVRLG